MRLWSLHPSLLDAKGLVALWRETLLAQKVLLGGTKGYRHHPQLVRFQKQRDPVAAIGAYLVHIHREAEARGYEFDGRKIVKRGRMSGGITVNDEQIKYEFGHLLRKLKTRDPAKWRAIRSLQTFELHPLFREVRGPVEDWERA